MLLTSTTNILETLDNVRHSIHVKQGFDFRKHLENQKKTTAQKHLYTHLLLKITGIIRPVRFRPSNKQHKTQEHVKKLLCRSNFTCTQCNLHMFHKIHLPQKFSSHEVLLIHNSFAMTSQKNKSIRVPNSQFNSNNLS